MTPALAGSSPAAPPAPEPGPGPSVLSPIPPSWRAPGSAGAGPSLWGGASVLILAAHVLALATAVLWRWDGPPPPPPEAAVMLELAPMETPVPRAATPPAPRPAPPPPPRVEPRPTPRPPVAAPPKPSQPKSSQPKSSQAEAPRPDAVAPPVEEAPRAAPVSEPVAAVPPPAAVPAATPDVGIPSWQGALRAHLERYKRYPSVARFRRQQGVSFVRFAMTRDGQVRWARLERGSGAGILDEEALELVTRAQPLPAPPPEVAGGEIEIVVPIQFFLR